MKKIRERSLVIKLSQEELDAMKMLAYQEGLPMSALIRHLVVLEIRKLNKENAATPA